MGKQEKRAYLDAIKKRYRQASRNGKGTILDEFCAVCGYQRKYAIRLLNRCLKKAKGRKPGRPSHYDRPDLLKPLKRIWMATDQMCGKRLVAAIPDWLPHYESSYGALSEDIRKALLSVSAATLDRLLRAARAKRPKGRSGTKPGTLLKNQIPIRTSNWDISQPGFMEADTVAHCGNSMAGNFVWSLTLTDIDTGWTECRAVWNKGSQGVVHQIKEIEADLPFSLKGFDCDNGSEFLNHHLLRYFSEHPKQPAFTRSRPYKKNDNAHVEQKNWTHVRHLFGYDRFEDPKLVEVMNSLYAHEWSQLQNHFSPTFKLKSKKRIGARYQRIYCPAATPYSRILASAYIDEATKEHLRAAHETLNPFILKRRIEGKLKRIFSYVSVTSNVRHRI